jgi:hypothetical protein
MKDIDDNEAFMQLVLCNPQCALSPLELRLEVLAGVAKTQKRRGKRGGIWGLCRAGRQGFPAC